MGAVFMDKVSRLMWETYTLDKKEIEGLVKYLQKEIEFKKSVEKVTNGRGKESNISRIINGLRKESI